METIAICKDKDVLKSYLNSREKEVVDIMMALYDKEQIFNSFLYQEREEAKNEGMQKGRHGLAISSAQRMSAKGVSIADIADFLGYSTDVVKGWLSTPQASPVA